MSGIVVKSHILELPPICFLPPETGAIVHDWTPHIPFLSWLIYHQRPRTFVEIGVLDGNSYFAACQAISLLGLECQCTAIDPWEGEFKRGNQVNAYSANFYNHFIKHNERYPFSVALRKYSLEAAKYFEDNSIDLLHIDANHSYDAIQQDFRTWYPKVSNNGIVLFHDIFSHESGNEVPRFWNDLMASGGIHGFFTNDFGQGLGVIMKGEKQPSQIEMLYTASGEDRQYIDSVFELLGGLAKYSQTLITEMAYPDGYQLPQI